MLGNTFGRMFRITTCGESYSGGFRKHLPVPPELYGGQMVIVDGVPPGLKLTAEIIGGGTGQAQTRAFRVQYAPQGEGQGVYFFGSDGG